MGKIICRHFVAAVTLVCALGCTQEISRASGYQTAGLIGDLKDYTVGPNESLIEVARKFDLGFNAIVAANPGVDPWVPPPGSLIYLPTAWILPDMPSLPGIVINIPELRLYYFSRKSADPVVTFPLGIGDQGRDTPAGRYRVIEKIRRPAWHVPNSIRSESISLPKIVPPGPDNPLGSHALRLSRAGILIHGTNRPWGIGRRSSHGCLRLYPEDIAKLFEMVPNGTRVTVINQPIKACALEGRVFVEAHRPESGDSSVGQALHLLADKNLLVRTDFAKLVRAMEEMKGMPVDITLSHLD
jgi:L,D-transpeptidase ErfK/SrfK